MMRLIEEDKCPRCKKTFSCSKSVKCWCYEVSVPENIQDQINKKYDVCLCPDCLNEVATGKTV